MKLRTIVIFTGDVYDVPPTIQRIDHRGTHGWQLRYGGTKLYSDHSSDGSGAAAALARATRELLARIARLPVATKLQAEPSQSKTSDLPVGITGPVLRERRGSRVRDCSLSVSIPRFGDKPRRRSVYIGTENTATPARFNAALERALEMRRAAELAYQRAETRAKRNGALALKAAQRSAAGP